VHLDCSA